MEIWFADEGARQLKQRFRDVTRPNLRATQGHRKRGAIVSRKHR